MTNAITGNTRRIRKTGSVADTDDRDSADAHQPHLFLTGIAYENLRLNVRIEDVSPSRNEVRTSRFRLPRQDRAQGNAGQILTLHFRHIGDAEHGVTDRISSTRGCEVVDFHLRSSQRLP